MHPALKGRLAGKVAVVSGGARGLGEAVVRLFVLEGANVVAGDVLIRELRGVEKDVSATFGLGRLKCTRLDVSRRRDWDAIVSVAEATFGGLDILVNNAGISGPVGIEAMPMVTWDRIIAVNQTGTLLGMRAAIPAMRRRRGGSIVNVSSIYSMVAASSSPAYQASKAAVEMLTRAAALEYGPERIRVNSVHPGLMDTKILEAVGAEKVAQRLLRTPLGRVAAPTEIAQGVLFLASEEASFVTGAALVIDGGYTAC